MVLLPASWAVQVAMYAMQDLLAQELLRPVAAKMRPTGLGPDPEPIVAICIICGNYPQEVTDESMFSRDC